MFFAIALGVIATLLILWQGAAGTRPPVEHTTAERTVGEPGAASGARAPPRAEPERPAAPRSRIARDLAEKHRLVGRTGDPSMATLRVIVTDERGHLLAGIKVNVILIDFEHGVGKSYPLTADTDGRVEMASLTPGKRDWAVMVGSLYRAGERLELIAGRVTEAQAVIPSGATVEGEVRHPETGPLSGVTLALQAHDSRNRLATATDEAGRYRLTAVPPGVYGVSVEGKLLGRRPRHVGDLVVRGLGTMTADFVVGHVSLRGAVLDRVTNQPLPGVRLVIHEPDSAGTTTDEHGAYRFLDLPTGDCRLSARKDGYETRSVDVRELAAGETRYLDVALRPAAILHIYVTDAGGRPVSGKFRLSISRSRGDRFRVQTAHVVTDEKGYARYSRIGPGTYLLSIAGAGGRGQGARVEIAPGDNTVRLQLEPASAK